MLKKPETDAFLFLSKLFDFQCSDAIEGQYHLALQDPCTTLLLPEPKEAILPTLWSRFLLKVLIVTSSDKEKRNQEVRTEWEECAPHTAPEWQQCFWSGLLRSFAFQGCQLAPAVWGSAIPGAELALELLVTLLGKGKCCEAAQGCVQGLSPPPPAFPACFCGSSSLLCCLQWQ